jgi:DNA processing protein|uniref:DNA-processing protein DprA n=1 Tax=Oceanispirochaeta sp. TaxID=2035350 RepID=UPI00260BFEAB
MNEIKQIDCKSREYPALLRQIQDPPEILYYRGEWNPELFTNSASVVGSRKMTRYGATMTERLVTGIAREGITIVSGFMYGIDALAHESAVNAPGRTMAVMPCGIGRIHPEYQKKLYDRILETGGLILSEYPGDTPPALWTYPRRNRIVAGLSPLLLVIEAGLKSGALITARIARKYNRKIYALPGPLTSSVSQGTALLIKQGAFLVTEESDILKEYGIFPGREMLKNTGKTKQGLNKLQRAILDQISREGMTADDISRALSVPPSRIGAELTVLTLKQKLSYQEGFYVLTVPSATGGVLC